MSTLRPPTRPGTRPQRTSARNSASTSDSRRVAKIAGGFTSSKSPRACVARRSAIIWSRVLRPRRGTIPATGRPLSVTSIVSPATTRRISALAFYRSSRMPALIMFCVVAHRVLLSAQPRQPVNLCASSICSWRLSLDGNRSPHLGHSGPLTSAWPSATSSSIGFSPPSTLVSPTP